jgi:hypothetical protein
MLIHPVERAARRIARMAMICGLVLGLGTTGCDEDPVPAPGFSLTDINPASSTQGEERSVHEPPGRVLLLYFVSFG